MLTENIPQVSTDVLIIGTEAAGAKAALEIAKAGYKALVVTKSVAGKSGVTVQAVATYNAALGPDDSPELHLMDTLKGGKYLNNQAMAELFTREAPNVVHELEAEGCKFARQQGHPERYDLYHYPGHSQARGAYTYPGGTTGRQLMSTMIRALKKHEQIKIQNDVMIIDILTNQERTVGALGVDLKTGGFILFAARAVILTTGGAMQIFSNNAAAREATGDGYAMAYRLGLPLVDMEFCQFFPYNVVAPKTLYAQQTVCQLCQNFGAQLLNYKGERFMVKYDPVNMERGTRDIVSRGIFIEIKEGRGTKNGGVYMDVSFLPKNVLENWIADNHPGWDFGGVKMLDEGIDLREEAIEIAPLAHFYLGGIQINTRCETGIAGLFAAGEVCGGSHGANRLGGNALPEVQVFGKIAGNMAVEYLKAGGADGGSFDESVVLAREQQVKEMMGRDQGISPLVLRNRIQEAMFEVSLIKDEASVKKALGQIESMREDLTKLVVKTPRGSYNLELLDAFEDEFMLDVAEMHLRGALLRTESRGAHYRLDYQEKDDQNWLKNIIVQKKNGRMNFTTTPVVFDKVGWEGLK
ncbi:MAG TPA: FAD-binding protein [Clostridia bacterium]|nr:FAD-binding protein [Clostridia bacterium]